MARMLSSRIRIYAQLTFELTFGVSYQKSAMDVFLRYITLRRYVHTYVCIQAVKKKFKTYRRIDCNQVKEKNCLTNNRIQVRGKSKFYRSWK